jgi:ABC-type glycerol-3-phosphate transport system substrate-binding protein
MASQDRRGITSFGNSLTRPVSRRRVLAGGAGLAAAAALRPGFGLAAPALQGKSLKFYNDKAPWEDFFKQMGKMAGDAIGVSFEPVEYSDTTTYQQTINSALPTNDVPDLFTWWSGYRMEDLVQQGVVSDTTEIFQAAIKAGNLPESLAAAFTFDNKQYAMPLHVSYWPMFYNKQVFTKQGIEVPKTWDDVMAAAEKLKGAGITPFFATTDGRWPAFIWFEELLIHTNPTFYKELCDGKQSYTDPVVTGVFDQWKEMLQKDWFTPLDTPMDSNAVNMFVKGEYAMMPVGTWFNQQFVAGGFKPGEDYDVFILPNVDPKLTEKVIIFETGPMLVPTKAKDVEASKKVAAWWVTPEAETKWAGLLQDVPANPKAKNESPVLSGLAKTITDEKYTLLQRYWENSPPQIVESAVDELGRFMLNPGQGADVQKTIQQIAETEWAKRKK